MTDEPHRASDGFTVKEIVVQIEKDVRSLDAKLDAYIGVHQGQHVAEGALSSTARADPKQTAAGLKLLDDIRAVGDAGRDTRAIVDRHEVAIQRLYGATTLASALGLGGVAWMVWRAMSGQP